MTAFFLQQLINGLTLGAVYGLIAIGYTMVYGIIGMINFAHGEVYMVSAYLCAIGLALLSFFGIHSFPLLIFATLVFTIVVTGVYGWAIERIAYRPLRNSTRLAPLISAIGMSLILQNYVQLSQGPNQQGIPTLLSGALRMTVGDGVVQITWTKVFILVAALVGMLILTWIIQYTRLGRICRATQQDRRMAAIPWHQYRPGDLPGVCHRRGDGRSGRRAGDHELRHLRLLYRIYYRHQSLHRRGAGRDRLAAWRDAGWSAAWGGRKPSSPGW